MRDVMSTDHRESPDFSGDGDQGLPVHRCEGCGSRWTCPNDGGCEHRACDRCRSDARYWKLREVRAKGKRYWLGGALALLCTCALLVPASARAADPPRDWLTTSLFVAAAAALVVDLGQTIDRGAGAAGPERNPLLGDRPGRGVSYAYFGGLLAAEAATYWLAPRWVSRTLSAVTLAVELPTIGHNIAVGVRLRF